MRVRAGHGHAKICGVSSVFLDTNVLAYQFDASEPAKQERVRDLLADSPHTFVISTQVLLELFVVITRKLRPAVPSEAAQRALTSLTRLHVVPADARLVLRAAKTSAEHQMSVWDAMIVEAAFEAGCEEIWTEDLSTGAEIRGVRIADPLVDH